MEMRSKNGFTLIELLVVIAIIAILAAILFPVFAKAREQARSISCVSNVKELGLAFQMYLGDYDGVFPGLYYQAASAVGDTVAEIYTGHVPPANQAQVDYVTNCSARAQLDPYIKSQAVWKCPSDSGDVWGPDTTNAFAVGQRWTSYHYRLWYSINLWPTWGNGPTAPAINEQYLPDPAKSFVFSEFVPFHDMRTASEGMTGWNWPSDVKENYVFADGHAKTYPVSKVMLNNPAGSDVYDMHWPRHLYIDPWQNGAWLYQGSPNLNDLDP
jgi:prepilin-type N-terminal cleavage/methylation domain-containing protein